VLLDRWTEVVDHELSTASTTAGYVRRTIRPALGDMPLRKLQHRVDILDRRRLDRGRARHRHRPPRPCTHDDSLLPEQVARGELARLNRGAEPAGGDWLPVGLNGHQPRARVKHSTAPRGR